jgi:hypothetical protein
MNATESKLLASMLLACVEVALGISRSLTKDPPRERLLPQIWWLPFFACEEHATQPCPRELAALQHNQTCPGPSSSHWTCRSPLHSLGTP